MIESIITFLAAAALLAFSPGPDNLYVLTQSIVNGSKSGIATTAGLIAGCIVHTSVVAFGISTLIIGFPPLFMGIKLVGALYLLYLAYKVYKAPSTIDIELKAPKKSYIALFKQGILMNILNPKVTIFFLAFFPGFLWEPQGNIIYQFYILGFLFMIQSFIIFSSIALIAGNVSNVLRTNSKAAIILKWLQIIVFIGIAVYVLLD